MSDVPELMSAIPDPIFVRGLSRSGGTLMCTLLDAHSDIAMSYELYPTLLEVDADVDLEDLARKIGKAGKSAAVQKIVPSPRFAVFVARCERSGLSRQDVADILHRFSAEGGSLIEIGGRMRLIELCALEKMHRLGKRRWGMKCSNSFLDYLNHWPRASFLNMLRDGRDVLASQLNTGDFKHSPREVGQGWANTHRRFKELLDRPDARAYLVRYERLTVDAEATLREICAFLDIGFDPSMMHHHELDLTVFRANHLSGPRISKTVDTASVGRWKNDLSAEQLAEFMSVAGDDLANHGYL